jgi:hypothetical protein
MIRRLVAAAVGVTAIGAAVLAPSCASSGWPGGGAGPASTVGTTATPVPTDGTVISITPNDIRCVDVYDVTGRTRPVGVVVKHPGVDDTGTPWPERLTCLTAKQAVGYSPGDYFPR